MHSKQPLEQFLVSFRAALGEDASKWTVCMGRSKRCSFDKFSTKKQGGACSFDWTARPLVLRTADKFQVVAHLQKLVEAPVYITLEPSLAPVTVGGVNFPSTMYEFELRLFEQNSGQHVWGNAQLLAAENTICLSEDFRSDVGVFYWLRHKGKALSGGSCTPTREGFEVTVYDKKDLSTITEEYADCLVTHRDSGRGPSWASVVHIAFSDVLLQERVKQTRRCGA